MIDRASRIYVAGHSGMVGSALVRRLHRAGFTNVVTADRRQLDLTRQAEVEAWFADQAIDYLMIAAARVGGIHANDSFRAEFIYQNLMIQTNLIDAAYRRGVRRGLFLGSSCIYPRDCAQPMREEYLLGGPLEATNEPYAVAKIAGIKLCQAYNSQYGTDYVSLMPTNLYGENDNFDLDTSHVIPAMIRKIHEAKATLSDSVQLWGTGRPLREFMHVNDLADACVQLMQTSTGDDLINAGTGEEISIAGLADMVREVVGYDGEISFDPNMPDGTPRKLLDSTRLRALGWAPRTGLRDGLDRVYRWYLEHLTNAAA